VRVISFHDPPNLASAQPTDCANIPEYSTAAVKSLSIKSSRFTLEKCYCLFARVYFRVAHHSSMTSMAGYFHDARCEAAAKVFSEPGIEPNS